MDKHKNQSTCFWPLLDQIYDLAASFMDEYKLMSIISLYTVNSLDLEGTIFGENLFFLFELIYFLMYIFINMHFYTFLWDKLDFSGSCFRQKMLNRIHRKMSAIYSNLAVTVLEKYMTYTNQSIMSSVLIRSKLII